MKNLKNNKTILNYKFQAIMFISKLLIKIHNGNKIFLSHLWKPQIYRLILKKKESSQNQRNNNSLKIPILLGTTSKNETSKSSQIYHFRIGKEEIIFSPSHGKKSYIYVLGYFYFAG